MLGEAATIASEKAAKHLDYIMQQFCCISLQALCLDNRNIQARVLDCLTSTGIRLQRLFLVLMSFSRFTLAGFSPKSRSLCPNFGEDPCQST